MNWTAGNRRTERRYHDRAPQVIRGNSGARTVTEITDLDSQQTNYPNSTFGSGALRRRFNTATVRSCGFLAEFCIERNKGNHQKTGKSR